MMPGARSAARVFAAIELPPDLAQGLGTLISRLQEAAPGPGVRWVRPAGIHLTLKFFGPVAPERLPAIEAALAEAAARAPAMELRVERLGVFPNPAQPRVIWAGVSGDLAALRALQQDVEARAQALDFRPEARDFSPHLTLGRASERATPGDRGNLNRAIASLEGEASTLGNFVAEHLSLMRSDLRPHGAVYTRLFAAPLGNQTQ